MSEKKKITVAHGDGIGPEIMNATLRILEAANAPIETDVIEIGEKVYLSGETSGISPQAWDSLRDTQVFLKAPITTPQGGGYKSLNVTIRKTLGLFANVRPVNSLHPFIVTKHPKMDLVIIRENEEDLYAGIEHQQTPEVVQCLKLITRPGCEKIVRYAFEYAKAHGRKKVTCFSKDNIMKLTDGLFHKVFKEIGKEYPEIEQEHMIIDIASALLADQPERMDVIVTLNLYGDIVSDIAAQISGSVGLGGSANIGENCAMFEAIHGSAPDIAGKSMANPSGLINAAVMMLMHINEPKVATMIKNALLATLEDGIHTADIYREGNSRMKATTEQFTDAIIERLGQRPNKLVAVDYKEASKLQAAVKDNSLPKVQKRLVGVDVFIDWDESTRNPDVIGKKLETINSDGLKLKMITNRGVKVYPEGNSETFCTDHWRCRFVNNGEMLTNSQIIELLGKVQSSDFDFIKTENLYTFDGVTGYSLGQGE